MLHLTTLNNLALLQQQRNNHAQAEALLRQVTALARRTLGDTHEATLKAIYNLAACLQATGQGEEAGALFAEEVEGSRARNPDAHAAQARLARLLVSQGKLPAAEALLRTYMGLLQMLIILRL